MRGAYRASNRTWSHTAVCAAPRGRAVEWGIGAAPRVFSPMPATCSCKSRRAYCASDRRSRKDSSRRFSEVEIVMKVLFYYCETQRILRVLHARLPYRRPHCRHDLHWVISVQPSRCRWTPGRSYSRSTLKDARHNRPHVDQANGTGGTLWVAAPRPIMCSVARRRRH